MPEDADTSVAVDRRLRALNGFVHREILMIACKNLAVTALVLVETDEIAEDVEEPMLLKHPFEEDVIVYNLFREIMAVGRLPLHITVFVGCDRPRLRLRHVAHHTEHVVMKQLRNLFHIVANLPVGCRHVGLFPGG